MVRLTVSSIIALVISVFGALPVQAAMWEEIPGTEEVKARASIAQSSIAQSSVAQSSVAQSRYFKADLETLRQLLMQVVADSNGYIQHEITLPMPDGRLSRFNIIETSVMAPALAQKFPDFKAFKITGIDDIHSSGRVDISPRGFHGMLSTPKGRVFIEPEQSLDTDSLYASKARRAAPGGQTFACGVESVEDWPDEIAQILGKPAQRSAGFLQKYRLAVSATQEYVSAPGIGGTRASAQLAIMTAINRVNDIYERDLGITLELVANNNLLIEEAGDAGFSDNPNPIAPDASDA
ncbi:MAG: hypothetical protein ACI822_002145, partial [Gammaproteobacteria bacterium]